MSLIKWRLTDLLTVTGSNPNLCALLEDLGTHCHSRLALNWMGTACLLSYHWTYWNRHSRTICALLVLFENLSVRKLLHWPVFEHPDDRWTVNKWRKINVRTWCINARTWQPTMIKFEQQRIGPALEIHTAWANLVQMPHKTVYSQLMASCVLKP